MQTPDELFKNNKAWAKRIREQNPDFFLKLSQQQSPDYLWIGCSDSRVPATEIVDLLPGEIFVHRNVANLVVEGDLNCLSVMQFAVQVLKVRHIIVCGHYGCGGVQTAYQRTSLGLIDNWLRHIQAIRDKHGNFLSKFDDELVAVERLCELNVIEQVANVCNTSITRDAWERGQELSVHGWIYGLKNGLLHDLGTSISNGTEASFAYQNAIASLPQR
jgi:carbonic anhydrase